MHLKLPTLCEDGGEEENELLPKCSTIQGGEKPRDGRGQGERHTGDYDTEAGADKINELEKCAYLVNLTGTSCTTPQPV